jgi:hypothetical protein
MSDQDEPQGPPAPPPPPPVEEDSPLEDLGIIPDENNPETWDPGLQRGIDDIAGTAGTT